MGGPGAGERGRFKGSNVGIMEAIAVKSFGEDGRFKAVAFAEAVLEACYSFEVASKNKTINEKYEARLQHLKDQEKRAEKEAEVELISFIRTLGRFEVTSDRTVALSSGEHDTHLFQPSARAFSLGSNCIL